MNRAGDARYAGSHFRCTGRTAVSIGAELTRRCLAIAAEIVALHRGGTTRPLTESNGPIHHDVHHAPTA
ncbi:hypothetical protein [Streptomyces lanatus]|uniref:Uncharacterized protein n=1 Tax=Streptomyces lanatus TaxID=66900 RepID=A0ABV1Y656_9ACTN|nr:hypothetical protein [Streptomyces lanatus]GHH30192.1 hypothetical protein GCM10018780_89240 [Streptomyces lanatus]